MKKLVIAGLSVLSSTPMAALAYESGDMILRVGAAQVQPQNKYESYFSSAKYGVGHIGVNKDTQLNINAVYMLTNNIGVELLLASPFTHKITMMNIELGETKQLPPTLSVQYYMNNSSIVTPYVGAGINYTIFYNENLDYFGIKNIELKNSIGLALQAGIDIDLGKNWGLNVDLRQIDIDTEVKSAHSANGIDVYVDPLVYSLTALYKF